MTECSRCGRDTDCVTLAGRALCPVCADWAEEHTETRDIDQTSLEAFDE